MTSADLKVVGIMRGSHLHTAGTKFFIHIIIGDDGDTTVGERQEQLFAYHILVAGVRGIDCHGDIAQHCFRAGGGNCYVSRAIGIRVADMPQLAFFIAVFHFVVGQGGYAARAPVDDVFTFIDQTIIVEAHKHFFHAAGKHLIHGETLTLPIAGCAQQLQLVDDDAAFFFLPAPDSFQQGFPADLMAVCAFFCQLLFHHVLGSNAGVIHSRQPQCGFAIHSVITDYDILKSVVEYMTHVQDSGNIGRRD